MTSPEGLVAWRAGLLRRLADFPDRLEVAAVKAGTAPPRGAWTSGQIVGHLIAVEVQVWQARLRQVAEEDSPSWAWTEPGFGRGLELGLGELLAAFRERREETLAIVRELDDAGWRRTGAHATFGVLDVGALLGEATRHDDEHVAELRRRRRTSEAARPL